MFLTKNVFEIWKFEIFGLKCLFELAVCDLFPLNSDIPLIGLFLNPKSSVLVFICCENKFVQKLRIFRKLFFTEKSFIGIRGGASEFLNRIQMDHSHSTDFSETVSSSILKLYGLYSEIGLKWTRTGRIIGKTWTMGRVLPGWYKL